MELFTTRFSKLVKAVENKIIDIECDVESAQKMIRNSHVGGLEFYLNEEIFKVDYRKDYADIKNLYDSDSVNIDDQDFINHTYQSIKTNFDIFRTNDNNYIFVFDNDTLVLHELFKTVPQNHIF